MISQNKQKLIELEKSWNFLFHWSLNNIDILEPRQAYNRSKSTGEMEKDWDPCICATNYVNIAIFRSLINSINIVWKSDSAFGMKEWKLYFIATKNLLEWAKYKVWKVFILDKSDFKYHNKIEFRSKKKIKPISYLEVWIDDLPEDIEIKI